MSPAGLREALSGIHSLEDPRVLVTSENMDDAGVYKINEELALIQTVDFFTPILNDPYDFGQVAVANALSDVYAMGGMPLTALNIACFPDRALPISILEEILKGGADKLAEAGVILLGGHTVSDDELKYGLAVTGAVHPDKILKCDSALPGDAIVLTKALGTGILSTALKKERLDEEAVEVLTRSMKQLNREAIEVAADYSIHAVKDITGFGLAGHAAEMADASGVSIEIDLAELVPLPCAMDLISEGVTTGGEQANRQDLSGRYRLVEREKGDPLLSLAFDPQTSGGLFLCVERSKASNLVVALQEAGLAEARVIGSVLERRGEDLLLFR